MSQSNERDELTDNTTGYVLSDFAEEPDELDGGYETRAMRRQRMHNSNKRSALWTVLGLVAELLFTCAAICALYVVWQMWWTGVQAEHVQQQTRQSVQWSDPGKQETVNIAQAQAGDPPVQPETASTDELIAQIYVPRFGDQWVRNIVQGAELQQINEHGLGHYPETQMPGELGNFAIAGHRNGYGQPLANVDKLQPGDSIIIRTKDYWYVYEYTSYKIVLPSQGEVLDPNPENPGATPTKRMITLTTCEPKYTTATHRWISFGELKYWAKVSDGVPEELATKDTSGKVKFVNNETTSIVSRLDSLVPVILWALLAYVVIFLAAAVAWRWPVLRQIRSGERKRPEISVYGWLMRHQPGVMVIRLVLMLILLLVIAAALFEWGFPWAASHIPMLQAMSNYVTV